MIYIYIYTYIYIYIVCLGGAGGGAGGGGIRRQTLKHSNEQTSNTQMNKPQTLK